MVLATLQQKVVTVEDIRACLYLWPDLRLYTKQWEVIEAALTARETYVPAGNQLGKDYVSAFFALSCFLVCQAKKITCRIVTTSVAEHHLKVLWGEIGRFIEQASRPLVGSKGGPLTVNFQEIRRADERDSKNPLNYLIGRVSEKGEGLAGHHAEFTMLIGDESSGLDDSVYEMAQGWAQRMLFLGNPNPCTNMFYKGVEAGDLYEPETGRPVRRVIRIRAQDSPNVRLRRKVYPGILTYEEYLFRRSHWDEMRQCIGLDGEFWKKGNVFLFPQAWLLRAAELAESGHQWSYTRRSSLLDDLGGRSSSASIRRGGGCDPAEGGDKTSMVAVDENGVIEVVSKQTPDTACIPNEAIAFLNRHSIPPERFCFDRGGGGYQHACILRSKGYNVQTVGFGEGVEMDLRRGLVPLSHKLENREERYSFRHRRDEIYWAIRELIDPSLNPRGFAIPRHFSNLHRELALIPLRYDDEGRFKLPPKYAKQGMVGESKVETLVGIIGHSPDESDALALAVYGMQWEAKTIQVGAF
jgi:hypothetical protein